jgi:hypothetical protein
MYTQIKIIILDGGNLERKVGMVPTLTTKIKLS